MKGFFWCVFWNIQDTEKKAGKPWDKNSQGQKFLYLMYL